MVTARCAVRCGAWWPLGMGFGTYGFGAWVTALLYPDGSPVNESLSDSVRAVRWDRAELFEDLLNPCCHVCCLHVVPGFAE